jgi:uncharacterized protein (TIGR02453 family)
MLHTNTIAFLTELGKNNNKPWFEAHKDEYQAAKADFEGLVTGILDGLGEKDPTYKALKAKDCVFRIFRDVRFSKDKSPYKANFGASFSPGGHKAHGAGYYFHLEPDGKSFAGGGIWEPEAPDLKKLRQEIDYNFSEFQGIVSDKDFAKLFPDMMGDKLKNPPKDYSADNPAIEYLKLKSLVVSRNITDSDITSKGLLTTIKHTFDSMIPFIAFLNRAIE